MAELDPETVKRLGLPPDGPKARELSDAEVKLLGLKDGDTLLNKARVVGTGAIEGTAAVGDAVKSIMGKPELPASIMPKGVVGDIIKQGGYGGTGFAQKLGLPTKAADEAKRLGVRMDPVTSAATAFARNAAPALLLRSGMPAAAMTGAGAAVGQSLGGDTGETIGAFAGPLAAVGASRALGARAAAKPSPTSELYQQADDAFARMRAAGAVVDTPALQTLQSRIAADLARQNFRPSQNPQTKIVLSELEGDLAKGALSFDTLHSFRSVIGAGQKNALPGSPDARYLSRIKSKLDDFLDSPPPGAVIAGNQPAAIAALREGNSAYRRAAKADEIAELINKAKNNAPGFSQTGMDKALRDQFKQLANSPRRMRFFSAQEQAQIEKIVRSTKPMQFIRFLGGMAPKGTITGAAHGANIWANPALGLPLAAGLSAARIGAARSRIGDVKKLDELIRRGAAAPNRPLTATERLLLRAAGYGGATSALGN